ncbi:MAG: DNA translocase FtsK [Gammaproteobacteria bacterium]|nr:DNA translocase FtsK [Gammaproteobacteria bacterium]
MNISELIGKIVTLLLKDELSGERGTQSEGTARFTIDCLSAEHTAAVARQILSEPSLAAQIDLKLPKAFLDGQQLPEGVLTSLPATYFRNATTEKPVLLIANTGDDEEQSLKEFTRIGGPELQEHPELWVRVASEGLSLSEQHAKWWEKALTGLQDLRVAPLDRIAGYVLQTRSAIQAEGYPIHQALGVALPALRLPKDSVFSSRVKEGSRGHVSAWKKEYSAGFRSRGCYLLKQTPSQLLLGEEELGIAFENAIDAIPVGLHPAIEAFIHAPSGWNADSATLSECEWEQVRPLFDGVKREKFNLAKETIHFFDEREPELLSDEERQFLQSLVTRSGNEPTDDDTEFYEAHRNELKEDRKLKSAWDRFVFGKARETDDFLLGIAMCMESLFSQGEAGAKRKLKVRCDRATKKELKDLNVDAGLYFALRYAGAKALFGDRVSWNVGQLFDFPKLVAEWGQQKKTTLNRSTAKAAIQLKFVLELEVDVSTGGTQSYSTQLLWKYEPNAVSSQLVDDWNRLAEHPLVYCRALQEPVSTKGTLQTVDLANVKTFVPAYDRDRGSFVSVYKKPDIAIQFRANVKEAVDQRLVTEALGALIETKFGEFEAEYTKAIKDLCAAGLHSSSLRSQAVAYSGLLDVIVRQAKGDRNRELLLRPLLSIGAAHIEGGTTATVVTPWHPLRLSAMQVKAAMAVGLVRHLLTAPEVFFGDTRLYFKDLAQEMSHPFYPEVVLGWRGNKPELMAMTDAMQDYTLHESPIINDTEPDDTNENPTTGSNCVLELVQRYLTLHPHEHANMSVVLYNCDSARLPQAVVDRIGQLYEDEDDVRCQVLLRHGDASRLRDLYRAIISQGDADVDSFNASEATQDFMARLRICIIADQAPPPNPKDGCPYDIVFSQDVIARHSQVEWYPETATPVSMDTLVPARWSRRRAAAIDDMKSVVYLCCPVQTAEGWSFLTALTTFLKGDWDENEGKRLLPARQLDFRDNRTARIFEETHNLGNWVVNYDELLDRRQLLNLHVRVIRYKQSTTQGRNVIISSKAPLGLLISMVLQRIKALNLGLSDTQCRELAERFVNDANDVSGDIVLRAAKRGRNASELMGIVLSRFLLRHELGQRRYHGWYFLDDYADWLGQREEQIADILCLSPEVTEEGTLRLTVLVSEAKYIELAGLSTKRKESQKQLRDTVKRINEAVFGAPERLDRDLWLARLSDLILDGVQFPANARINLADWRRAIREGACEIAIRGYSHVFVWGPDDPCDCSSFAPVAELEGAYQEVFGRPELRELVRCYFENRDPLTLRRNLAQQDVWSEIEYQRPTDCAKIKVPHIHIPEINDEPPTADRGTGGSPVSPPAPTTPGGDTKMPVPKSGEQTQARPGPKWAYPGIVGVVSGAQPHAESNDDSEWLHSVEIKTKHALQQFQLQAKVVSSTLTPNCALIKFAGSSNLTVEQVSRKRSELLTTYGLNVVAIRPEPGLVSLSIERPKRRVIRTPELWARWQPAPSWGNRSLLIGVREDDGELLFLSPGKTHAPHTLIAGSTGSGKSVLMQNIILAIAATNTPGQARIALIDPKQGVDYFAFESLPHLDGTLVVEPDAAIAKLEQLVAEMDARYGRLRAARCPSLDEYNKRSSEADRLPVIWVVHDEFAEWMMVDDYKEAVTNIVGRLGVKARAAGIHLVFAAQRPDANVMPMQLRANLGNRLILKVDSAGTSEIALGEPGAEFLLGHGHLLAKLEGTPGLCFAQVPLADADFVDAIVNSMTHG